MTHPHAHPSSEQEMHLKNVQRLQIIIKPTPKCINHNPVPLNTFLKRMEYLSDFIRDHAQKTLLILRAFHQHTPT